MLFEDCETYEMTKEEFEGVVMIVILSPRKLRAFERSSIGMVWP